ncbi:MAG: DUF192 domain-containing protein [Candidatus Brockarchaeota archaeon]|nr:DUF192 domain-containing protein [Candidatus Brockarchaeota archaeon]
MGVRGKIVKILLISAAVLLCFWTYFNNGGSRVTEEFQKMSSARIRIVNDEGQVLELEVKVADEPDERAAGFQNISRSIIEKTLILFIFPDEVSGLFHMRNVEASLDIAFIKADGAIVGILRMDPSPTKLYGADEYFKYAFEAPAGFFMERKITPERSRLIVDSIPKG